MARSTATANITLILNRLKTEKGYVLASILSCPNALSILYWLRDGGATHFRLIWGVLAIVRINKRSVTVGNWFEDGLGEEWITLAKTAIRCNHAFHLLFAQVGLPTLVFSGKGYALYIAHNNQNNVAEQRDDVAKPYYVLLLHKNDSSHHKRQTYIGN